MSFLILLSLTAERMPVSTEFAAALLSFRYPSIQLFTSYAQRKYTCIDVIFTSINLYTTFILLISTSIHLISNYIYSLYTFYLPMYTYILPYIHLIYYYIYFIYTLYRTYIRLIEDITRWREHMNFIFEWQNNILRTSTVSE